MIRDAEIIATDVLVIGGGGSASRAAIAADNEGAVVHMVVKGLFGHSGCTPVALGGFAAALATQTRETTGKSTLRTPASAAA